MASETQGRKRSIESKINRIMLAWFMLVLLLSALLVWQWRIDALTLFTFLALTLGASAFFWVTLRKVLADFLQRIGLQLDALAAEEHNTWHLAEYNDGLVADLKSDFQRLNRKLQNKKFEYQQTEEFVFGFIELINLPIVVLDHHLLVYRANPSFSQLLGQSGMQLVGQTCGDLGFSHSSVEGSADVWSLSDNRKWQGTYEIAEHRLNRNGRQYRLLVLFSIEQKLRDNEKHVWQKLLRVINHEVRNSLTPIYSMAQSLKQLKSMPDLNAEQKQMETDILNVIESRAQQLMQFVDGYSVFNKLSKPNKKIVKAVDINHRLLAIFPNLQVSSDTELSLTVDQGQLEQALINLIKNGYEASTDNEPEVAIDWQQRADGHIISIRDRGKGIQNEDNLFTPFYTTKADGTGVGLLLSRELIRNQGGELTIQNHPDGIGAVVTISL